MLSRWLFVRIRAAERALQDGRLDEAYVAAIEPDVRADRRGQQLFDGLVRPLIARARLHLQAGRYQAALSDLDKLTAIGRTAPDVEELRQRVVEQMRQSRQRDVHTADACARAAANLDEGRLESGRLAIERIEDTQQREGLREQLDVRVQRSAQALAQAKDALARGDVLAALRFWQETCERHGQTGESDELAVRLAPAYRKELEDGFAHGRLEALLAARPGLGALRRFSPALDELDQMAVLCSRAAGQLTGRDYAALKETMLRLRAARGSVKWIDGVLAAIAKIGEGQDALLASPLGLFASRAAVADAPQAARPVPAASRSFDDTRVATGQRDPNAVLLGTRGLLLLVDGSGSSLLLSRDHVRIGRAGGSRPVDVPIPADVQSHHADLVRDREDYFLTAHGPVHVNHREAKRSLLRDGDRIMLADAAKFVFRKPSVRSDSAVLQLSHRSRLSQDVSQVILFRDTCLIGSQPSCHIRTQEGQTQVVLFERAGALYGRETTAGGGKLGDAKVLPLGQSVSFGDVRITVKEYESTGASRLA